ncbi:hypothetical protein Bequi_02055 [Brachybacterium sp. JHP9]|uniref:Uncharacterized protein n=1 Tax=Brachybacterium equifaecis TaxID=2910770 RepID=A0ABT0QXF7_9MICO|nr:hypothetical protein [Brachybacterium equifaecis]MCL6422184.1 hypothetical protein [Brachybacterium equifaecis]
MSAARPAVQEIWKDRQGARTRADVAYLLYLVLMVILVVVIPAGRTVGILLARPDVVPVLTASSTGAWISAGTWVAAAALVLAGGVRGPALLSPFFTLTLASSDRSRRAALARPFGRSVLAVLAIALAAAALVSWVLHVAVGTSLGQSAPFLLGAAGTALLLSGAWLLGERAGAAVRRLAALALAAVGAGIAAVQILLPGGAPRLGLAAVYPIGAGSAGLGAGLDPGVSAGLWAAILLLGGTAAVLASIVALDRVRGTVLLEQSSRWEGAVTIATTGDLAGAGGAFRARPSTGRRLPVVRGSGAGILALVLLHARRDALAWLRTPERLIGGILGALGAGFLLVLALGLTGPLRWILLLAGAAALWAASGALIDGLRHAVESLGATRLLAQSIGAQCALHAVAPVLALAVLTVLGGIGALIGTAGPAAAGPAAASGVPVLLLVPALLSGIVVLARIWAAAKGPMPLSLATPMPTPMGDASIAPMLLWQAGELLLVLFAAVVLGLAAVHGGPLAVLSWAGLHAAALSGLARGRIRELTGESENRGR